MNNKIKKIIKEILHKQIDIHNSTEELSNEIIDLVINTGKKYPNVSNGGEWEIGRIFNCPSEFSMNTNISEIKIHIDFIYIDKNKINGFFNADKTRLLNNGNYQIQISFAIQSNQDLNTYRKQIEYILSHEMNHAFRYIKLLDKKSKQSVLNRTKNITNQQTIEIQDKNPAIKKFMEMFYLSLPQEMDARLQETATQLKYINKSDYNETIESLLKFQPLNDAKKMIDYNLVEIKNTNIEVLKEFIKIFNENLKNFSNSENTNLKNNIDDFFNYWTKIIKKKGDVLFRKIMKMVSDKHNLKNEDFLMAEMDKKLLKEISGFEWE